MKLRPMNSPSPDPAAPKRPAIDAWLVTEGALGVRIGTYITGQW